MKKIMVTLLCFTLALSLADCETRTVQNDSETEAVPADYGDAVTVAQEEFDRIFSEYDHVNITQTAAMVRTNHDNRLVIQFTYSSGNGNGVYGFEMEKTATGSYDIIQQGENVTIDHLVNNQSLQACRRDSSPGRAGKRQEERAQTACQQDILSRVSRVKNWNLHRRACHA